MSDRTCGGCEERIKDGSVVKALNRRWHPECFKCGGCGKGISGSFLTKEGMPYCKPCYNNEHGMKCEVCREFITGHILKYNDKSYHYPCVSCKSCSKPFTDGAALSVKGGQFIHNDCKKLNKSGTTRGDAKAVKAIATNLADEPVHSGDLTEFDEVCLEHHNKLRAKHNAAPLTWSEKCAEHARMWAEHLADIDSLAHDSSSGMGENCGYFASSRAGSKSDTVWAENVCDLWYSEIKSYSFSKNDYQPQTGHFTQMIWKGTQRMGSAIVKQGNKVYIVANYFPAGNFMGKYKENIEK